MTIRKFNEFVRLPFYMSLGDSDIKRVIKYYFGAALYVQNHRRILLWKII